MENPKPQDYHVEFPKINVIDVLLIRGIQNRMPDRSGYPVFRIVKIVIRFWSEKADIRFNPDRISDI